MTTSSRVSRRRLHRVHFLIFTCAYGRVHRGVVSKRLFVYLRHARCSVAVREPPAGQARKGASLVD